MENRDCFISYGSDIFYPQSNNESTVISPVVRPEGIQGVFTIQPGGLEIDLHTGKIDLSKSDWGTKYTVTFTTCDQKTTCSTTITLSGIDYQDGIYNLSKGMERIDPFYNAVLKRTPPQGSLYDTPPRGTRSAASQGLAIDQKTGLINLRDTLKKGAFGPEPISGLSREFKVYYQLNDPSQRALSSITLRIHYYKSEKEIPKDLRVDLRNKQQFPKKAVRIIKTLTTATALCALGVAALPTLDISVSWEQIAAGFTILATGGFFATTLPPKPLRPPVIIIVEN